MKITCENIILDTDPRIRQKSEKVELPLNQEDKELLEALLEYVIQPMKKLPRETI